MGGRDDQFHPEPCPPAVGPTLRDRFAMAALPAIVATPWCPADLDQSNPGNPRMAGEEIVAISAYRIADAMLRARTPPEAPNDR